MKKGALFLAAFLAFISFAAGQEIFDLIRKGDVPAVRSLVEKSPDVLRAKQANGSTPLHLAATAGMKEMSALLLEKGAALEARDDYGRTPLVVCARELGQVETGKLLIDAGADVEAADKFGSTSLELAAWRGKADFVGLLLAKGAKIPTEGRKLSLFLSMSASQGLTALFDRIISAGGDLKAAAAANPGLLSSAAAGGSAKIIAALLDLGLDPAGRDRFGWTPLHYAARDGRTEAVGAFIDRKVPLDARTIMGQTPYNVAVERKMEAAAALLAEKGADRSALRFPVLQGDYLGQKPPEDASELFGLGIISSIWGLHSTAVFSPDGNEVLWAPMIDVPGALYSEGGLLRMKREDGRWTAPEWAPFSDPKTRDDVPFYSLDGKRIYFISARPLPNGAGEKERIWYVDQTASGWSEPRPLDPALNDHPMHWSFSLDKSGNLYFSGQGADSRGMSDIYVSRFADGRHQKPENLGDPICSALPENTPFVAPDGSYLLFSRQYDIWASFRTAGGAWSAPVKLGPEINSPSIELCPSVTADGKFIFFLSQRDGESHAYWVKADVIDKVRPSAPVTAADAAPAAPAFRDPLRGEYLGRRSPP